MSDCIYIFSNKFDIPTDNLIEQLHLRGLNCLRFDELNADIVIKILKTPPKLIYIRKINYQFINFDSISKSYISEKYYQDEELELLQSLLGTNNCKIIGWNRIQEISRITALEKANFFNLAIPKYEVVNSRKSLDNFNKSCDNIVIRPLRDSDIFKKNGRTKYLHVQRISKKEIEKIPEVFFPALIMEEIDKEIDIKIIYFNCQLFVAGIYSESNSVDSRVYLSDSNLNFFSINLPDRIESKIKTLVAHFNLLFCTIDLILDKNGRYYFLDINPSGQYSFIAQICNFKIDELIADYIKENVNKNEN